MIPLNTDEELMRALLEGKELESIYGTGTLKLIDGKMVFMNKRWQYIDPKVWYIKVNTPEE